MFGYGLLSTSQTQELSLFLDQAAITAIAPRYCVPRSIPLSDYTKIIWRIEPINAEKVHLYL